MLLSAEESPLETSQILFVHLAEEDGEMVDLFGMVGEEWFD